MIELPSNRQPAEATRRTLESSVRRVRDYELQEILGRGGMGVVYRAVHTKLDKTVALKLLNAGLTKDSSAVVRFEREIRVIAALDHQNIVRADDAGESDGMHFLVMELIDGIDLSQLVRRLGPLAEDDACELIRQAALGLQHAHDHDLVHRDVKPSNLILATPATVKLVDLGLARLRDPVSGAGERNNASDELTDTGQTMGTFDYMAPEQATDARLVDHRADLYSLGCTLYKLLTGRAPFDDPQHTNAVSKMMAHAQSPVPPIREIRPDVTIELLEILERLLAKKRDDRYETAADLVSILTPLSAGADLHDLTRRVTEADCGVERRPSNHVAETPVDTARAETTDGQDYEDGRNRPSTVAAVFESQRRIVLTATVFIVLVLVGIYGLSVRDPADVSSSALVTSSSESGPPHDEPPDALGDSLSMRSETTAETVLAPIPASDLDTMTGKKSVGVASVLPLLQFQFEGDAINSGSLGADHDGVTFGNGYFNSDAARGLGAYDTGTNGYVRIPPTRLGDHVTIASWLKLDPGVSNIQAILSSWTPTSGGFSLGVNTWTRADRVVLLETWTVAGESVGVRTVPNAIREGQWHHVAVTLDRDADTAVLYVDGERIDHAGNTFADDFTDNLPLSIGRYHGTPESLPFHFTGLIDDLRIYDTTLSATQISELVL
jgi:serine/threonine protein kinase